MTESNRLKFRTDEWEFLDERMPRVIVFDFDGTLVDSLKMWDVIGLEWIRKNNLADWPTMQEEMAVCTLRDAAQLAIDHYKLESKTVDEIETEWKQALDECIADTSKVPLKHGVKEFLQWLHCTCPMVLCYVATSNIKSVVQHTLELHKISQFFTDIITSSDVTHPKPDPEVYMEAARRGFDAAHLAVKADQVLVIEDNFDCAMNAKKLGMKTCAVYDDYPFNAKVWKQFSSQADYRAKSSLDELILPLRSLYLHE